MYTYRKLTPEQQADLVAYRRQMGYPPHAPPHLIEAEGWFLITAATYEHRHHFATEDDRAWLMEELAGELDAAGTAWSAWVVQPNHYHLLAHSVPLDDIRSPLRRVHARTAVELNRRDGTRGRQVWYRFTDRAIRNEAHYYATLNYIHYNPVKHGYVRNALEWRCSSVHWYREHYGVEWLRERWQTYPVRDYGKGWDW